MDIPTDSPTTTDRGSSQALVFVYWLAVLIPLSWGVFQTAQKSIPLFHVASAPMAASPEAASTPPQK